MGSSPPSTLDPFQQELLRAFFNREQRFVLTGGAALGGFHLGHRTTRDLDLFTVEGGAGSAPGRLSAGGWR
jgi:hypothetical protein